MTRRRFIGFVGAALAPLLAMAARTPQPGADEGLRKFQQSIDEYVELRRRLEERLPPLEVSNDAQQIQRAAAARAAAISHARSHARTGELFNPAVSELFRARIRETLAARHGAAATLLREMGEDGERWQPAVVNGHFSWTTAAATPPCVLAVLPPLPAELQYRFVGPDLTLVDVDASLILDVIRDTLQTTPGAAAP